MNNLLILIKSEIQRLYKYKIMFFGIIVTLIWVMIIAFSEFSEIKMLVPMLIMIDAAMMNIILLSASFYLEKQEGTIKSVLVAPVKVREILISKIIASIFLSLISAILMYLVVHYIHHYTMSFLLLVIYIIIIVFCHTAIGFLISLFCKDFSSMIGIYALYAIIAILPSILYAINIIPEKYNILLMISPSHSAQIILNSLFMDVKEGYIIVGIIYLICLGLLLYVGVVYKRFKNYAIGG